MVTITRRTHPIPLMARQLHCSSSNLHNYHTHTMMVEPTLFLTVTVSMSLVRRLPTVPFRTPTIPTIRTITHRLATSMVKDSTRWIAKKVQIKVKVIWIETICVTCDLIKTEVTISPTRPSPHIKNLSLVKGRSLQSADTLRTGGKLESSNMRWMASIAYRMSTLGQIRMSPCSKFKSQRWMRLRIQRII